MIHLVVVMKYLYHKIFNINQIYPLINHITPGQTALSARTRTVSGTSAGGNEVSFLDQGFEDVQLNAIKTLSTPRLVASPINETARLNDLPLNRSNTIAIRLLSGDKNLSPVIDMMNASIIYIRNRLNKPIDDYALDSRVKLNSNDPHAGVYISNRVDLKQPATSLQVLISAQKAESADFRVLYKLFNSEFQMENNHMTCSPDLIIYLIQMVMVLVIRLLMLLKIVVDQMQRLDQVQMVNF